MRTLILLFIVSLSTAHARSFPSLTSKNGMVAADSAQASQAGAAILAAGGDAIDAAVTTALVLGVVHPFASGIGGGGFAVVHRVDGSNLALDFREMAPADAGKDMYLDQAGNVIPKASTRGPKAAGVPGELAGLARLHKRFGKLPWAQVVEPALKAARDGFPADAVLHSRVTSKQALIAARPVLARTFLKEGKAVPVGGIVKRPDLARTLAIIAEQGATAFYNGPLANRIAGTIRADGGLVSVKDLAEYTTKERPLVKAMWKGYAILSMPPPSSGGAVLIQVLRALEQTDLKALGHNSSAYLHRLTEALKHAFADRANVMGDPDFTPVPIDKLIGDATIKRVQDTFQPQGTHPKEVYGGSYGIPKDSGTTHFNVIDKAGNAVAITSTVNTSFGSLYVAGDTGVLLNNQMDDFVSKPGVPNAYGLVGRKANAIEGKKRPLSSMSPTLVLKDGQVVLAVGASGGPTIITGTLQVLLNVIEFGMDPRTAIEVSRVHHQWVPERLMVESDLPRDVVDALVRRGHVVKTWGRFNAVQAITNSKDGQAAACDPSKQGVPAASN